MCLSLASQVLVVWVGVLGWKALGGKQTGVHGTPGLPPYQYCA